jgi:hypothetical protein
LHVVADEQVLVSLVYEPGGKPFLGPLAGEGTDEFRVVDHLGGNDVSLLDFLRNQPPQLFTASFESYCGSEFFAHPDEEGLFDPAGLSSYDWIGAGVNIRCETKRGNPGPGKKYILEEHASVLARSFSHVFIDDGSGEVADIVACQIDGGNMTVRFSHCKASRRATPGGRVDDVYVVSGQVIKSVRLFGANRKLRDHLSSRHLDVVEGSVNDVLLALDDGALRKDYEVELVQPGIAVDKVTKGMLRPLAAAKDYVLSAGCKTFIVVGSPGQARR